jgi:hypothetical protein
MGPRAIRWLLFGALALALPFPMLGPFESCVPPVRYAMLLGAAGAVAVTEGMAGPVPLLLGLLALNLLASLAVAWLAAWATSRALGALGTAGSPARQRGVALAALCAVCVGLALAAAFPIYRTAFGRAPTANLLGVLH